MTAPHYINLGGIVEGSSWMKLKKSIHGGQSGNKLVECYAIVHVECHYDSCGIFFFYKMAIRFALLYRADVDFDI